MMKTTRGGFPALLLVCSLFVQCRTESAFPVPDPYVDPHEVVARYESDQRVVEYLSTLVDRLARRRDFNGVVLFARDEKQLFHRAYGWADRENLVPNTSETKFNLASASKMFTAVAIAKLTEDGRLSSEDPIGRYLDSEWISSDVGARVRIAHLLNHTSGLGHYWDEFDVHKDSLEVLDDYKMVISDSLAFDPGTDWEYSNTGFILLGAIIEQVSGETYYDFVREVVFDPCGMTETGFFRNDRSQAGFAIGYFEDEDDGGRLKDNLDLHGIRGASAGGGWSTAADLHRFLLCFHGNDLLRRETREAFLTPNDVSGDYGYGFQVKERWTGHWGGFPGIEAFVMYFPDTGHSLVILSNYYDSALPLIGELGELAAMFERPPSGPSTWLRVLEGPSYGALFDAVLTDEHHVIAVGATNHLHVPPYSGDALFVNVDAADGTTVWERTWGGDGYEQAWGIARAADDGYYVFGETDSHGAGDRDFFLLKTSPEGEELWVRTYGTPRREWPFGMLSLANGDLLIYGRTESTGESEDAYALRIDPDGNVVWEYTVRTALDVIILDALETETGQIILCTAVAEDGALTALGPDGRQLWTQRYELDGWQFASAIEAAEDGYLLAGFSMIGNGSRRQADVWLAKTSASGELEWQKSFGEPEFDDYAQSLRRVSDKAYLVGGLGRAMPLWKIDGSGNLLWERRLDDSSVYAAEAIIELHDGGFLVSGLKSIVGGRSYDAVLLRTDAEGRID